MKKDGHEISTMGKSEETESTLIMSWDCRGGGIGSNCFKGTEFPFGEMEVFWS